MREQYVEVATDKEMTMKYDRKSKACEICGKKIKPQGYGGHLFLVHNVKTGVVARLEEVQKRLDKIEGETDHSDTAPGDGIEELEKRLDKIEKLTGSSPVARRLSRVEDDSPSDSEAIEDLAAKVKNLGERIEWFDEFFSKLKLRDVGMGFFSHKDTLSMSEKDWSEMFSEEQSGEAEEEEGEEEEEAEEEE